jgi:outer membrane protein assembly factor BamB
MKQINQKIICLIVVLFIFSGSGKTQTKNPAFDIRGWVLLDYNMPYLRKMIPLAAKEGINHIQLCHKIGMQLSEFLEPQRNRDVRELIDLAHEHGIKIYVWTHELDEVPSKFIKGGRREHARQFIVLPDSKGQGQETFVQGGKVAAYGDDFWDFMSNRYETLLDALPDLDGVVVTLTETNVPIDDDNLVTSPLTPTERFVKMSQQIYDVLKPRGKELILRTFTWIKEDFEWMPAAFTQLPEDIIIMSKVNWGDWYQHYPSNPFIGAVAPHRQIIEYDLVGQYHGDTHTPWVCADFLQQEMQYGISKKAAGVIARVDWGGHAYDSGNEFNAVAYAKLAHDPFLDLDNLWEKWASNKYSPQASPYVISALKRSNDIANLIFFTKSFKILKSSGTLIGVSHMDGTRIMHSLFCRDVQSRWKPELLPLANELINPTLQTMKDAIQEKEKAIELINASLKDLDEGRRTLTNSDYLYLTTLFRHARLLAQSWRWINEAYFRYLFFREGDFSQRGPLNIALSRVLLYADKVDYIFEDRVLLLHPERMRNFIKDIQIVTQKPVKWIATTNVQSMSRPLFFDIDKNGTQEIVINGQDNKIHAFSTTGEKVWDHEAFGLRVRYPNISDPAIGNVNSDKHMELVAGAADGNLYTFDLNGNLDWKFKTDNSIKSAPVFVKDENNKSITVCASLDGYLYGIDGDGEKLWETWLDAIVQTNLLAIKNKIFLCTNKGLLKVFDAKGQELWTKQFKSHFPGYLASHKIDGEEFISVGCGTEFRLYGPSGKEKLSKSLPQNENISTSAFVFHKNGKKVFIVGTDQGSLFAFDKNGNNIFTAKPGERIRTAAVQIKSKNGTLLFIGVDNAIVGINDGGEEIWRFTAAHDAFIGNGLLINEKRNELLFTARDRKLYCVDIAKVLSN